MRTLKPKEFVLRCYGSKDSRGKWYGNCIDLNIAAEADTVPELRQKLGQMITSYIETVFDTDDADSIPDLFHRRSPFLDIMRYHLFTMLRYAHHLK